MSLKDDLKTSYCFLDIFKMFFGFSLVIICFFNFSSILHI